MPRDRHARQHHRNLGEDASVHVRAGARIYRLAASTYYVDTNPAGQPALIDLAAGAPARPRRKNWSKASRISRSRTASTSMTRDGEADYAPAALI